MKPKYTDRSDIKTTRPITSESMNWLFEGGTIIKLKKKQHLFLTRGSKHIWAFSFPSGVLRPLHHKLLQLGYNISLQDFKTCAFVLDLRGVRLKNGDWLKFEEDE